MGTVEALQYSTVPAVYRQCVFAIYWLGNYSRSLIRRVPQEVPQLHFASKRGGTL